MIPKELKRDADGLTRLGRIEHADQLVAHARVMAAAAVADRERAFTDFADDDCHECVSRAECGLHVYDDTLHEAADYYRTSGLGLLAERVRKITQTSLSLAWLEFDANNITTET